MPLGEYHPIVVLSGYCVAVVFASLLGGRLTQQIKFSHNGMQHIISLVGGVMLGTAVFHLLPHALAHAPADISIDTIMLSLLAGMLVMFAMLRVFHHHHHGEEEVFQDPSRRCGHEHDASCGGVSSSPQPHAEKAADQPPRPEVSVPRAAAAGKGSWLGVFFGLTIHTLIDGVTLAAAVAIDAKHAGATGPLLGLGAFMAVFLHKPLDAISITSVMAAGGRSLTARRLANFAFALACPLGAALCYAGLRFDDGNVVAILLAFSAGVFLCIALSDLLPEMEFHSHDRVSLSTMLVLGLIAAWMLRFLEGDLHG